MDMTPALDRAAGGRRQARACSCSRCAGSSAAQAGIQPRQIITHVVGQQVTLRAASSPTPLRRQRSADWCACGCWCRARRLHRPVHAAGDSQGLDAVTILRASSRPRKRRVRGLSAFARQPPPAHGSYTGAMPRDPADQSPARRAATRKPPCCASSSLQTYFPVRRGLLRRTVGHLRAVDGVSFDVQRGQTLGLVGESGCGKTTVGRTILRLIPATGGRVLFDGQDVFALRRRELKRLPPADAGHLPGPRRLAEPAADRRQHHRRAAGGAPARAGRRCGHASPQLLERVGLAPEHAQRYPHEFSGGQRQRIGIARALALEPRFIVCDEPVSALDVSIQAQILNLLKDLQNEMGLSYLFIAHNLAVVEHFCDRMAVMYLGRIVDLADRAVLYSNPRHPYTQALLSAAPHPRPDRQRQRIILPGEVPSPVQPPTGCKFHPRCHLTRKLAAGLGRGDVRADHGRRRARPRDAALRGAGTAAGAGRWRPHPLLRLLVPRVSGESSTAIPTIRDTAARAGSLTITWSARASTGVYKLAYERSPIEAEMWGMANVLSGLSPC